MQTNEQRNAAGNLFDVVVLGGGLAGLTLTRQLLQKRPDTRVLILEKRSFPVDEAAHKVGESTVEIGAYYLSHEIGLKKHLVDEQLPKFGLRFFFQHGLSSLAEGTEVGSSEFFPAPGYQIDRGRLENHLADEMPRLGATLRTGALVRSVELEERTEMASHAHQVRYRYEGRKCTARGRWIVDASGRAGFLRSKRRLAEPLEHNVNAVWFRIGAALRVDDWCDDPHWRTRAGRIPRRWLSTNHLFGRGYWVWIIPLASGATSIGIVTDPQLHPLSKLNRFDKALQWLQQQEPTCAAAVAAHAEQLQDFRALKRLSRGCRQIFSTQRWALTGEAGVFLDPLYSPGIDYIAIGNSMICRLIEDDLHGRPIDPLAQRLESTFQILFRNNLLTYQDQYPIFGNPRVMSLKYVWDYALYWAFPALLYFHGKLTDPEFIQGLGKGIEEMRSMNLQMQRFFREWEAVDDPVTIDATFVDQHEIGVLLQLNAELRESLDDEDLSARFRRNVTLLRELMSEILERVRQTRAVPAEPPAGPISEHRLNQIFEALNL